jgi:hypothetical protein
MKWVWLFIVIALIGCDRPKEPNSVCYIFGWNVDVLCYPNKQR